jgi:predicted Rossmann fold flavoprotein
MTGSLPASANVVIVGAGAAGLATAIFARRLNPAVSVLLLDGAKKPGAKILVSGGGRCNVANASVSESDFWGGRPAVVRRVLRALPVPDTIAFFREIGVTLHEEDRGRMFPDSNRARDVLSALLGEVAGRGALLLADHRVVGVRQTGAGFLVSTRRGDVRADAVVLATGGQALPRSGSDGAGFEFARALGHAIIPTTPALVPLVAARTEDEGLHRELSGVSQEVELEVWVDGRVAVRLDGSLLWTHFGVSGPAALDASRHWLRAKLEGREVRLTVNFCPGQQFDDLESRWIALSRERPNASAQSALGTILPAAVAAAIARRLWLAPDLTLAHLARDERRRIVHALVQWPLEIAGTRGYTYAEATAGGVSLAGITPATMESRVCRSLFLVGEMLDVDGRLGGFNFQWAWASARVAARALAARGAR